MIKECNQCKINFNSFSSKRKYCSMYCFRDSTRKFVVNKICPFCNNEFKVNVRNKKKKYCSEICLNKGKQLNKSTGFKHAKSVGTSVRKKLNSEPNSIYCVSKRTLTKILNRMRLEKNIGCSNCGWKDGIGDIHHINGRKIEDPHNHKNLCYLCPNYHRLVHQKILDKSKLINLENFLKDSWKEFYFG